MMNDVLIAEQNLAAQDSLAYEQRYRSLLASTSDYVYTVTMDGDRAVTTSHGPGCEAITGFTSREFDADALLWYRMIHEEDRAMVLAQIGRILKGEVPSPLEHRIVHKNGEVRWIRNVAVPRHDPEGRLVSYSGLISDITKRKRAEEALTTERNLLRTLIDNLPDYVYVKDTASRFVINNLAHVRVLGASQPADVLAKTDLDFFPKELALQYRADEEALLRSGRPLLNREEAVVDREGNRQWVLTTKVPWKDSQGKIVGLIGLSRDITKRKQSEEELRRAYTELAQNGATLERTLQELKAADEELKASELQLIRAAKLESIGTLAAGVAHEVKNPLQIILMGLDYLDHNLPPNHEGMVLALHDMRDAVMRATTILRGLLELAADAKSEPKPEDLNACVERSLWHLQYELGAARITVVRQLAADLPLVPMDRGKMEQVFINLFINAIHAMSRGGTLTVTTRLVQWSKELASQERPVQQFRTGDTFVVTEVQDTGTGIPEAVLPKIFDPFFTTKPVGHGTGLGLAVVKRIVDLHGGAIGIRNAPPGGVRVTLILKLG
jgi:PAS domain S-box-containing protein